MKARTFQKCVGFFCAKYFTTNAVRFEQTLHADNDEALSSTDLLKNSLSDTSHPPQTFPTSKDCVLKSASRFHSDLNLAVRILRAFRFGRRRVHNNSTPNLESNESVARVRAIQARVIE